MKKKYVTPLIAVEHYEFTQTIANCGGIKIGLMSNQCVRNDPDSTPEMKHYAIQGWFTADGGCTEYAEIGEEYDGFCYHTNSNAAFAS